MKNTPENFHFRLLSLGFSSYGDYLRSPHWARVRVDAWNVLGRKCWCCGGEAAHLHHHDYRKLGREKPTRDLIALCRACHEELHRLVTGGIPLDRAHHEQRIRMNFRAGLDAPRPDGTPSKRERRKLRRERRERAQQTQPRRR